MRNVKIETDNWMLYTKELEYLGFEIELPDDSAVVNCTKDIVMYPKDGIYDEYVLKAYIKYYEVFGKKCLEMLFGVFRNPSKNSNHKYLNVSGAFNESFFEEEYCVDNYSLKNHDILNFHVNFSHLVERVGTMMELVPVDYWHNDWREYCEGLADLHGKLTRRTNKKYKELKESYLDVMDLVMKEAKGEKELKESYLDVMYLI